MSPNFLADDFVFSLAHPLQSYRVGDVVLVSHASYGKMIKRIQHIVPIDKSNQSNTANQSATDIENYLKVDNDLHAQKVSRRNINYLLLVGDNWESVTTAQMGQIAAKDIIGKVVYRVPAN